MRIRWNRFYFEVFYLIDFNTLEKDNIIVKKRKLALELHENPWTYILKLYPTSSERKKMLDKLLKSEEVVTE
ncbi:MAG: hypothetical protein GXO10_03545 [Crenarchaeota archaeon]|nr:hypothetical protein [Thermoproteota archaeon]